MRRHSLLLIALLAVAALPAAAQVNDTYILPVSGNTPGAFGTRWMTQFSVMNPQAHDLVISIVFVPSGGRTGQEALIEVPSNTVAFSDNILDDLFDESGSGSLLVATFPEDNPGVPDDVVSRAFLVTSNTYNDRRDGTYGTTVPGVWAGLMDYDTDGISAIAHGIRNIQRQGWRTNIGAVNLGRTNVTMYVSVYDADGRRILNRAPFSIPPIAHMQDLLPVEVDRGSVEFFVDDPSGEAVVFPYASTIDQLSGDPSYQSPTLLASPGVLFAKGALAAQSPGKKLNLAIARQVRESANRTGTVMLKREAAGYRIAR
jgi:hypothetical protein